MIGIDKDKAAAIRERFIRSGLGSENLPETIARSTPGAGAVSGTSEGGNVGNAGGVCIAAPAILLLASLLIARARLSISASGSISSSCRTSSW